MFEYQVTFLEFGCSNSTYYNCTWLPNNYSGFFLPGHYTDNTFLILIWCGA